MSALELMFMSSHPAVIAFAYCCVALVALASVAVVVLIVILVRAMFECW